MHDENRQHEYQYCNGNLHKKSVSDELTGFLTVPGDFPDQKSFNAHVNNGPEKIEICEHQGVLSVPFFSKSPNDEYRNKECQNNPEDIACDANDCVTGNFSDAVHGSFIYMFLYMIHLFGMVVNTESPFIKETFALKMWVVITEMM